VLVLNGERDIQVSPDKDSRPLAAALRKRKQAEEVELVIVPGASHNLKDASADPAGFAGPVVPAAEDRLAAWLKMHLSGGRQVSPSVPR
jgi:pimeloyl-ACP methyl ester carboxylesterase